MYCFVDTQAQNNQNLEVNDDISEVNDVQLKQWFVSWKILLEVYLGSKTEDNTV